MRAGYRSEPHPDADISECYLLAGRRAEADALFADLRARTPEDVWLYNSAGFSYAAVADYRESARWFRDGIDVALRTGDADRVVVQLLEGLEAAWKGLGESPESGLQGRVEAFVETWQPPSSRVRHYWGGDPPPLQERRCEHCGYDPAILNGSMAGRHTNRFEAIPASASGRETSRLSSSMVVSLAWFPRGEWEKATATWPDLLEDLPADHADYGQRIEARLKRLAAHSRRPPHAGVAHDRRRSHRLLRGAGRRSWDWGGPLVLRRGDRPPGQRGALAPGAQRPLLVRLGT